MQKMILDLERAWKRIEWENQFTNCRVFMDMFRRYRDRRLLREALRTGKRYARLARKYA